MNHKNRLAVPVSKKGPVIKLSSKKQFHTLIKTLTFVKSKSMKQKFIILLFALFIMSGYKANAQDEDARVNTPVSFTYADRDRIMKLENGVETIDQRISSLEKSIDERFDAQQNQMNILFGFLFLILGGIMSLIAFVIYDRRTILKPITKKQEDLETVLIKYSRTNKELRAILQKASIL